MVTVDGNGTYTTPTGFTLPSSGAALGTYQWDASYSGDASNNAAGDVNDSTEQVTVNAADPTLSAAWGQPDPNTLTITDTADLENGYNPTGTITFTLYAPDGTTLLDTETVNVSGNGTYTTPNGYTFTDASALGSYQWDAVYSGDASNNAVSDIGAYAEEVSLVATTTLTTTPEPTMATLGPTPVTLTDTADLENGSNPTGTITFKLYGPDGTTVLDTETVNVSDNGTYTTPTGYTLPDNAALGTYQWDADYSGDADNGSANDDNDPTEQVTVGAPCYCPGTRIRTARGQKCVETLKIGDKVMTASGALRPIKWIGRRSYAGRFIRGSRDILPICIKAGALDDRVPTRDLWVSPHHAMYFEDDGGVLIEAKDLVNGVAIVQAESVEKVDYFHVELDSHDVIIAEGALAETFVDDDSRAMFHNAQDYRSLYPDAAAAAVRYCAPRRDDGHAVEAVRRRIAARAGLLRTADAPHGGGRLHGFIERRDAGSIAGWAQNPDHPEAPVYLDILAGGRVIGQVLANHYRADLQQAGIGSGRHGFVFVPPRGLALEGIEVRRAIDGVLLQRAAGTTGPQRLFARA
jgi:Hint domain